MKGLTCQSVDNRLFDAKERANEALLTLRERINMWSSASVGDFLDSIGERSFWTDYRFGWKDLSDAIICERPDGKFTILFPEPKRLDTVGEMLTTTGGAGIKRNHNAIASISDPTNNSQTIVVGLDLGKEEFEKLVRSQKNTFSIGLALDGLAHGPNIPEKAPEPSNLPAVWDLVIKDMKARDEMGVSKYGTRRALWDAYQEALDLVVYLRQAIFEKENSKDV
jgi:hypothetical protein